VHFDPTHEASQADIKISNICIERSNSSYEGFDAKKRQYHHTTRTTKMEKVFAKKWTDWVCSASCLACITQGTTKAVFNIVISMNLLLGR
jgi:hypothetical protein